MEIRNLKEDVLRLQNQCNSMQVQAERKDKKKGLFKWTRNLGIMPSFRGNVGVVKINEGGDGEVGYGKQTPMDMKTMLVRARATPKWRKSVS